MWKTRKENSLTEGSVDRSLLLRKKASRITFIILLIIMTVFGRHSIYGNSMYPTYHNGQTAYTIRTVIPPKRGQVVVAISPVGHDLLIKRVAGIPGDTVQILTDGKVCVNGIEYQYGTGDATCLPDHDGMTACGDGSFKTYLGKGEYFLIGDNLENSMDSRHYGSFSRWRITESVIYVK